MPALVGSCRLSPTGYVVKMPALAGSCRLLPAGNFKATNWKFSVPNMKFSVPNMKFSVPNLMTFRSGVISR